MRRRKDRPFCPSLLLAAILLAPGAHGADIDGDGSDDLLFRDYSAGVQGLLLLAGQSARRIVLTSAENAAQGVDVRPGDFDGDSRSEILARNLVSGDVSIWTQGQSGDFISQPIRGLPAEPRQILEAMADFDGDGRDDLLFRQADSSLRSVWRMLGTTVDKDRSGPLAIQSSPRQRFVVVGDFDADQRADLLLRDEQTLSWVLHLLDGQRARATFHPALPLNPVWNLEGTADMDGDDRLDLLFRRLDTGEWRLWFMSGAQVRSISGTVELPRDAAWQLASLADIDGDGNGDALLRHRDSGELYAGYLMQRWVRADSGPVPLATDSSWRVATTGDFDGNGAAEILLTDSQGSWRVAELSATGASRERLLDTGDTPSLLLACTPRPYPDFMLPPPVEALRTDTALLAWSRPHTRSNGEALCAHDLDGFRIFAWRLGSAVYREIEIADPSQRQRLIAGLSPGRWQFAVSAYDRQGQTGLYSEIRTKTIRRSTGAP